MNEHVATATSEPLFNPLSPDFIRNPYPHYARMRTMDPVHLNAHGAYVCSRHAEASLPAIELVDMRGHRVDSGRFLSPPLVAALGETLAAGEQALLFLNRRGYAPLTLCRACGHRFQCPHCTAWLVEHRFTARLVCHHCGYTMPLPAMCPECLEQQQWLSPAGKTKPE